MRLRTRCSIVSLAGLILVLLAPGVAQAKVAPASGSIDGDALTGPIEIDPLSGPGDSGDAFFRLVEQAGFFPATMGLVPDPMLDAAPTGDLGPELVVTWKVDEHGAGSGTLRQFIYPHATDGPLTYTEPGQEFFDGMTAPGGWYRAPAAIAGSLAAVGVPVDALDGVEGSPAGSPTPLSSPDGGSSWVRMVVAALLTVGVAAVVVNRRRERVRLAHR